MLKKACLFLFVAFLIWGFTDKGIQPTMGKTDRIVNQSAVIELGKQLFKEAGFSSPNGDLPASCNHCHMLDEDPQGLRAYTDFFNRSWISFRSQDKRRLALRNSPTILDVGAMPRLHYDGEFASLEDLVKGTLSGRTLGWVAGEEAKAKENARAVILKNQATYGRKFEQAFAVNIEAVSSDELLNLVAKAVADYCRTLRSHKNSTYDQFIALNGLETAPANGEDAKAYGQRLLEKIQQLETEKTLKLTPGFNQSALQGLKIFFRADKGNCLACHAPPAFTDHSFHNLGISQREYDRRHGEGKFAELAIPDVASAARPSAQALEIPLEEKPGYADLGFWNYVDVKNSSLRKPGESDNQFLNRMIGTFKTPTLRNLKYSYPYFHNGTLFTLDEVLGEMLRLSDMARAGRIREGDEELAKIKFTASDIAHLVNFLNTLNEDLNNHRTGK
ncbi:MAG: cytochrome c peroxidase [Acidobacteriota bacterium]